MLVIGLTGGIGCGKSSAASLFAALGAAVIDTDAIAHELTAKDSPALAAIFKQFGSAYRLPDGNLDRVKLRRLVFSDGVAKSRLEASLHPLIRKEVLARMAQVQAPYLLLAVPLFFETGAYRDLVDRVLVIDCGESQQVARTTARSGLSAEEVQAIMSNQIPRGERLRQADDILPNFGDPEHLENWVKNLHQQYLQIASGPPDQKRRIIKTSCN